MNNWYETEGFAFPGRGWSQYVKKEKQIRVEVGIGPRCPDCKVESKKFITTPAQLYGVPYEDYPAYPSAFQPRWDGEWVCPRCHKLVALTDRRTAELTELRR